MEALCRQGCSENREIALKRTLFLLGILALLLIVSLAWSMRALLFASSLPQTAGPFVATGNWQAHPYDLIYSVAFSSAQQPDGPLLVYRAAEADLHTSVVVNAIRRDQQPVTPLLQPSPDGRYLALTTPLAGLPNSASLRLLSSQGNINIPLVSSGLLSSDQVVWSPNSQAIYYHTTVYSTRMAVNAPCQAKACAQHVTATKNGQQLYNLAVLPTYDEIRQVDLYGHTSIVLRWSQDGSSRRLVGIDDTGALVLVQARPQQAAEIIRVPLQDGFMQSHVQQAASRLTLPSDIPPGNVLSMGSDGNSVLCERVLSWRPLRYTLAQVRLTSGSITPVRTASIVSTANIIGNAGLLTTAPDGHLTASMQVDAVRQDSAVHGLANVPAQETLLLRDTHTGATQSLTLPAGGQLVQAFWATHVPAARLHIVPQSILAELFAFHKRLTNTGGRNASPQQQDELMLEAHAGLLVDTPPLSTMCYGTCQQGATGKAHVSAAILHGIAFVESNWHQFNTTDYQVNGEAVGTPVESFDGGWGEYQQTWGMPPQCQTINNCRSDATRIENDQSYNIGVGTQSLISAWNGTAGVISASDPNDPYKANDWFFAVWAYNGSYGNNPIDVASSVYGQWYPGAPFRSIYEEYVWYFAAHPQNTTSGWTDGYLPSLGSTLLPPQSDFVNTSDSFVACVTCTIADWTTGSYDREWVAQGAPTTATANAFLALYTQSGGENSVGLPRDNGGGAAVHRWGTGWVQDFGGGTMQPGAFMQADGGGVYWVYGAVWTRYLADLGTKGCHGYPTSALTAVSGTGSDSYYRQNFQGGFILWDATTSAIAQDSCS